MEMLDKRLNDKGKNWRHVFKALTVLDYILHAGSENVVIYFKDNLYIVKTLKEFVYVDDQGKDVGHNVRQKAKDITNLLQDEDRLRAERRQRGAMRDRMLGNIADHGLQGEDDFGGRDYNSSWRDQERRPPARRPDNDEDTDLQRALQESMQSQQDEDRRRSQQQREEDELARALRLSEEEEAKRKREMEEANQRALMDDNFQLESNNMYSQQQQQPQQTGFPLVDMGGGWSQQQLQPQYTSYNVSSDSRGPNLTSQPFAAQMMQQQQQMYQQQLQQQQQEEYMRQQQEAQARAQMQSSLLPQHTAYGSNNPFAPKPSMPQQTGSLFDSNPQQSMQPQQTGMFSNQFSPQNSSFTPHNDGSQAPKPAFSPQPKKDDGDHAGLANLIGRGREDGLDTFGNVGNLREYMRSETTTRRGAVVQAGAWA